MAREKTHSRIQSTRIRKEQILSRCKGVCCHCGKEIAIGDDFTIEHIIPLSKGGTNDFTNLVSLCETCNKDKDADIVDAEYYEHAPKVVYEEIERNLASYFEENDWLTATNIFRIDRFDVPVTKTLQLRNGKVMTKKATCQIRKIKEDDLNAFVERYNDVYFPNGLPEDDSERDPSSYKKGSDYYQVICDNKPVMVFSYRLFFVEAASLCIEIFVNPDARWGPASRIILTDCMYGIVDQFKESLDARGTKSSVCVYVEALQADNKAKSLIEEIGWNVWKNGVYHGTSRNGYELDTVMTLTHIGRALEQVEKQEGENGEKSFTEEDYRKQEKLYRSQLKRRIKQNGDES